jgi:hypothetical protein
MELYFKVKGKLFDTNLPVEMQNWLGDCIELTDDVLDLLDKSLAVINREEETVKMFLGCRFASEANSKNGKSCYSPFDATANVLEENIFYISGTSYFEIGEEYYTSFEAVVDDYIEYMEDEDEDFDEEDLDYGEFGEWICTQSDRIIVSDGDTGLTYDLTYCETSYSLEDVRDLLSQF